MQYYVGVVYMMNTIHEALGNLMDMPGVTLYLPTKDWLLTQTKYQPLSTCLHLLTATATGHGSVSTTALSNH